MPLSRRETLLGLAAAAATATPAALADGFCGPPQCNLVGYCMQTCSVGLPTNLVNFVAARQAKSQWCWAACIQMVFAAHGYRMSQETFVKMTFGSEANMPGQPGQILSALNRV